MTKERQATLSGEIGSLLASTLKDVVEMTKFKGYEISIFIGSGFFSKPFMIKGDETAVRAIRNWLEANKNA